VNTHIIKQLKAIKSGENDNFRVPKLYKDNEDKDFVKDLLENGFKRSRFGQRIFG
jgi:N utilization substance protein B